MECVVECVLLWCGVWSGTGGVCSPVVVSVECVCVECVWWSVSGGVCLVECVECVWWSVVECSVLDERGGRGGSDRK